MLNDDLIRERSTAASFERGYDYYRSDYVETIVKRGNLLLAEVHGNH